MSVEPARDSDLPDVEALLRSAGLPSEDLADHSCELFVARDGSTLAGVVGLEHHGEIGLLRSLAVTESHRGRGLARRLCDALLARAADGGLREVWLLTETAAEWFERVGFVRIDRSGAPDAVRSHRQFTELCPASAVLMRRAVAGEVTT